MKKSWKYLIVGFSLSVFLFGLSQDAVVVNDYDGIKTFGSIELFLMGGLAILGGGLFEWLVWMSNPLYVVAIILFFSNLKGSVIFSINSLIIACSFMNWGEILAAENDRNAQILSLGLGYWCWLASISILVLGAGLSLYREKLTEKVR
ncbi:hypothetical protein [Owenweeksia hongkongensis]|uniref:hypothetical protein n=1 Tax=Owenweeksia hongkongensis TaxID=253245 RepID=UPI003A91F2BE